MSNGYPGEMLNNNNALNIIVNEFAISPSIHPTYSMDTMFILYHAIDH